MQVEERRSCASCGADNQTDAAFCWQCYASFAPAVPAATPSPVASARAGWGPTGTPAPPAPAPAPPKRKGAVVRFVLGAVVGLVVVGFVRQALAPSYHVPEAVGGLPRIHSAATDEFERQMTEEGDRNDIEVEAAAYGQGVDPTLFFVLANGEAVEGTDELFRSFLEGMEQAGATVVRSEATTGIYGDAEYRCVPVRARGLEAAACIWREDATVGLTLDMDASEDPSAHLLAAYDAIHA